jgi:hypothetical protein
MNGDLSGANALRLMGALIKSGAEADVPIANARVNDVAVQAGLDGDELERALVYAANKAGWKPGRTPGGPALLKPEYPPDKETDSVRACGFLSYNLLRVLIADVLRAFAPRSMRSTYDAAFRTRRADRWGS